MAKLIIPTPLRKFTNDQASIDTESGSVLEALNALAALFPELKVHLFDDQGSLRKFLRIYVGDQDIRELNNEKTAIEPTTVISIIPAIAGGRKSNEL
ncbi:MAG TPA: MoaD/ThiS family protein [Cyclobacteriaceae bacterium]|nr:MoaD/ThiS family protein [Cyclobacteriaceae bacterium]